ncbi:MAG TPA: Fis family transcriptional regulator [Phycisphaerales bacterium]|nr:Fis family transcriptional regulator [Phycisphaerales bacterium]
MAVEGTRDLSAEALGALVDASAVINDAHGLEETLAAIARAAAAVLKAEASSVILLDKARGKQVFMAAVGDRADRLLGVEYDEGLGISGKVMRTGRAEVVNEVASDRAHYKDIDQMTSFETRSLVAGPLVHKGRTLGVVEVLNPVQATHFSESDRQLIRIFANLAAIAVANAQSYDRLERENCGLKASMAGERELLGDSPAMREVREMIRRVARSGATVLLLGETGTGKDLAAKVIHSNSPRADRAFIAVNCAALPETLLESELFGHEAGAFTGAVQRKLGRFELADGGTIFLDEIGELSGGIQVKLLRVLQEKEIVRVGGTQTIGCDVRILAATHRDLSAAMRAGRFREDLFYRLNVFPIELPPLRDRREDVPKLAAHFLRCMPAGQSGPAPALSNEALAALSAYDFPGNVRELRNILERACLLCCAGGPSDRVIRVEHLPKELGGAGEAPPSGSALAATERAMVLRALEQSGWNQTLAARSLGITRDNVRYRMRKYGLRRP